MTRTSSSFSAGHEADAPRITHVERWTPESTLFDPSRPNIARIYDYWLGGKDNYPADRAEAERLITIYPQLPLLARQNRLFLAQAVQWVAKQGSGKVVHAV